LSARERIVIVDSSILMHAVKGKKGLPINIEEALISVSEGKKLVVLDTTIEELNILKSRRKGKTRLAADFALELIKSLNIHIVKADEDIVKEVMSIGRKLKRYEIYDEILVRMAERLNASVATIDGELVKKLRRRNIPCYVLHGYKWVKVAGYEY